MFYAAIGIPLTLVFLSDLSLLITRLIKYLSLILLRIYSNRYFFHVRQWALFRFIERQLNISIPIPSDDDDDDDNDDVDDGHNKGNDVNEQSASHAKSPMISTRGDHSHTNDRVTSRTRSLSAQFHLRRIRYIYTVMIDTLHDINDNIDLTMPQLLMTLVFYILIGAHLIPSSSYFDSVYICFTSLFSIDLRNYYRDTTTNEARSIRLLFVVAIYLLFGLAIVSLCVKAVQKRIQISLENLGHKLLRDLVEFLRQMGKHDVTLTWSPIAFIVVLD
jgi:hypothetical protein